MAARGLGSAAQGFKEFTDGRAAKAGGGARTGQDLAVGKVLGVHDDVDRAFAGDLVGVQAEGVDGHGAATFGHRGVTGARWGLPGAEAVHKLRAVRANGDVGAYWAWHEQQEYIRNHQARYRDRLILTA